MQLVVVLRFIWNKFLFENFCKQSDDVIFNQLNVGMIWKLNDYFFILVVLKVVFFKNIRIMIIYLCDQFFYLKCGLQVNYNLNDLSLNIV